MAVKTIHISDSTEFNINTSFGWLFIYKNEFGHDILPDLMPIASGLLELLSDSLSKIKLDKNGNVNVGKVISAVGADNIENALLSVASFELTTIIQIVWALAKNADKKLPTLDKWELDEFPLDVILPKVFGELMKTFISEKNLPRLGMTSKTETAKP